MNWASIRNLFVKQPPTAPDPAPASGWIVTRSPFDERTLLAVFSCAQCKQSATVFGADKAIFTHCGRTDSLDADQRALMLSNRTDEPIEAQLGKDRRAQEIASNAKIQPPFQFVAAAKTAEAQMRADADALAGATRQQEDHRLLTPTPRQSGAADYNPYIPGCKDT